MVKQTFSIIYINFLNNYDKKEILTYKKQQQTKE